MYGINQKYAIISLIFLGMFAVLFSGCTNTNVASEKITGYSLLNDSVNITLTIVNGKPQPPKLIFPVDVYTFNRVRFAWEQSVDYDGQIQSYNIQVSDRPNFESVLINVMVYKLTYEMPYDLDYKIYYFRVRAHDGIEYGPFSKVATFGIKPPDVIPPQDNTTPITPIEYEQGVAGVSLLDSDSDGVYDAFDSCLNTINNTLVDSSGCACYQKDCDDANICTDDYCIPDDAICRHYYNNTKKCGFFTQCPLDKCFNGNYYDYVTDYGKCVNGMCFENSCLAKITYESELCGYKVSGDNITIDKIIPEEEIPYDKEQESFDEDNDGVPNYRDKCLHSTTRFVDKYGCSCEQKRCIDLDGNTIDMCFRGRCIFAIKDSKEYNQTMELIEKDKEKPKFEFNFTLLGLAIALIFLFFLVFLIPSRRKEDENKNKKTNEQKENNNSEIKKN